MWKVVEEYPNYEIDDLGNIRNIQTKIQKQNINGCVRLYNNNKETRIYVHLLMNKYYPQAEETWRTIPEFSRYEASPLGQIRNKQNGKIIEGSVNSNGYIQSGFTNDAGDTKSVKFHRLIAITFISNPNEFPVIDHINNIRTDNRVENLRWADARMNAWNTVNNKTKTYKGVYWVEEKQKFRAQINFNQKLIYIGYFEDAIEAAKAYDEKAKELQTTCLNFPTYQP